MHVFSSSVIDLAQLRLFAGPTGQRRSTKDSVSITYWVLRMDKNAIWFKRKSGNFFSVDAEGSRTYSTTWVGIIHG
jgi:hypothetical protein